MNTNNQDINTLTKESLKLALLQMLKENTIENISITALTNKAGVSRMAYYRNYSSVTALYQDLYEDYFKKFFASTASFLLQNDYEAFFKAIFTFILSHQTDAKILLSSKENNYFLIRLNETFCKPITNVSERYFFYGVMGYVFNILTEWVYHDFNVSVDELAKICVILVQQGITPQNNPTVEKYFPDNNK